VVGVCGGSAGINSHFGYPGEVPTPIKPAFNMVHRVCLSASTRVSRLALLFAGSSHGRNKASAYIRTLLANTFRGGVGALLFRSDCRMSRFQKRPIGLGMRSSGQTFLADLENLRSSLP